MRKNWWYRILDALPQKARKLLQHPVILGREVCWLGQYGMVFYLLFLWIVNLGHPMLLIPFLLPFYGTYHFTCFLLHFGLVLSGLSDTSGSSKISNIGFDFLKEPAEMGPLFHSMALQQYIILCSQVFFCYEINYTYLLDGLVFLSLFLFYQFFNNWFSVRILSAILHWWSTTWILDSIKTKVKDALLMGNVEIVWWICGDGFLSWLRCMPWGWYLRYFLDAAAGRWIQR